jgi:hypothetical protein
LQRTRCTYFRDVSYRECNKRNPGSGCAAMGGFNRMHAVLGGSESCIATYPGDFAQALIALEAVVEIASGSGNRTIPFANLHRKPADTPDRETNLRPGEMIAAFLIPAANWTRRSLYLKVRDRESYEFALASAAVALDHRMGSCALRVLRWAEWLRRPGEQSKPKVFCAASPSTKTMQRQRRASPSPVPEATVITISRSSLANGR